MRLFVSISYGKGVIACDPYEKLDGKYFESYVKSSLPNMFYLASKDTKRLWLQDGDPSQNCVGVRKALKRMRAEVFSIPPRSPDLNPIENLFHLIRLELDKQAIERNICTETYVEFRKRIIETFFNFSSNTIDSLISSMHRRINLIIIKKGQRIKY